MRGPPFSVARWVGVVLLACHAPPARVEPPVRAEPVAIAAPTAVDAGADAEPDQPLPAATTRPPSRKFESWSAGDFEVTVSLPADLEADGGIDPRPIVVGIHGSHDRPEAACRRWRRTLGGYPFVVCPEGVPYRGGLAWGSPAGVAERIDRALAGLRERHGARLAEGPMIYAGFSLGATLGPRAVALRPGKFDVVVLAEVGHTRIDVKGSASSLRAAHGRHTLVACATKKCATFSARLQKASAPLKDAPTVAFVDAGIGRGHVFDDRMASAIGTSIAARVADDPRWSGLSAALASDAGLPGEPLPPVDDEPDLAP